MPLLRLARISWRKDSLLNFYPFWELFSKKKNPFPLPFGGTDVVFHLQTDLRVLSSVIWSWMSSRSSLSRAVLAYSVVPLGGAQRFSHRSFGLYFGESPLRLTPSLRIRAGIIVKRCRSFPFPHLHPSPPKYTQFCSFAINVYRQQEFNHTPKLYDPNIDFLKREKSELPCCSSYLWRLKTRMLLEAIPAVTVEHEPSFPEQSWE